MVKRLPVGTRSLLYGAHAFWLHPWFVAVAWWKLYGFPFDPRLWASFFLHDIGYWGCSDMDGVEGKEHPRLGAKIMGWLFDRYDYVTCGAQLADYLVQTGWRHTGTPIYRSGVGLICRLRRPSTCWRNFTLYHSRSIAKKDGEAHSKLCAADKLATALTPAWLYIPMVSATGEIAEYMRELVKAYNAGSGIDQAWYQATIAGDKKAWFKGLCEHLTKWSYKDARSRA